MIVRDGRRVPFFMVTKPAMAVLAGTFDGRRLQTARSIYIALVEIANDDRSDRATCPRTVIAGRAGVTAQVVDDYAPTFERLGLLRVSRGRPGRSHEWVLLDPERVPETPGACSRNTVKRVPETRSACSTNTLPIETLQEEENDKKKKTENNNARTREPLSEGQLNLDGSVSSVDERRPVPQVVDGRRVSKQERLLCDDVLAAFNARAGTSYRAAEFKAKIIRRIREHPELGTEAHRRIIDANFDRPWWTRLPNPGVIYGSPGQFERSREQSGEVAERYDRDEALRDIFEFSDRLSARSTANDLGSDYRTDPNDFFVRMYGE